MLETCGAEHNVKTFVSLSSPQGGQYGGKYFNFAYSYLPLLFINYNAFLINSLVKTLIVNPLVICKTNFLLRILKKHNL